MKQTITIKGMTCSSCVSFNESIIWELNWVESVQVNLSNSQAIIIFDENIISISEIIWKINWNWFIAEIYKEEEKVNRIENQNKETRKYFLRFIYSLVLSFPVFSMMFFDTMVGKMYFWVDISMWIFAILTAIVVFVFWKNFHLNFLKKLIKLQFNMDSLVSLWTLAAFFYSVIIMFQPWEHVYFEAAVAIITLINLWKYLEFKAKNKAWDAISKLIELWVKQALKVENNKKTLVDISEIRVWDIISVAAWEKIPLDWNIIEWESSIDESMLTWESIPVSKNVWDDVFWATINLDSHILVSVTKTSKDWTLSQIIELVNNAQSSKAPIQKMVDKISQIFVPIIIIISIFTFIVWYVITWDISLALVASVSTLVIACPCALWLATPAAIMVWTGTGAKNGILIKNAEALEKTKAIDVVIFDKTGTLTNWKPIVTDLIKIKQDIDLEILSSSLAQFSHHPLSKSIVHKFSSWSTINDIVTKEYKWKWLSWEINWETIYLWNKKLFNSEEINKVQDSHFSELSKQWKTPVYIWRQDEIYGVIFLQDIEKNWVENTISKLKTLWIETIMLTGDTKDTANFIWKKIGIDKIISEVLPEDKLNIIKQEQWNNKKVTFVWDWINDAPALVQADLSIAMWTWSDIAIESSDIVLVHWDLSKVVAAIELSRKTLGIIKQNLFWAFLYNSIWIPLAALWLLNPVFASFAMSMSSVSVLTNSLRLKKIKTK